MLKQKQEVEDLGKKFSTAKSAVFLGVLYGYSVHIFSPQHFETAPYMAELGQSTPVYQYESSRSAATSKLLRDETV